MKICFINSVLRGSTGKLVMELADGCRSRGDRETIIVSNKERTEPRYPTFETEKNEISFYMNYLIPKLIGNDGFCNKHGTKEAIKFLEQENPDIIHLNNAHGHYIDLRLLLEYLKKKKKPIVWTLHDAWIVTGRCAYFDYDQCSRWQEGCKKCPHKRAYPQAYLVSQSAKYWIRKRDLFAGAKDLIHFVAPSNWLAKIVQESGISNDCMVINNGVNNQIFRPGGRDLRIERFANGRFILGSSAYKWTTKKGIDYLFELAKKIDPNRFCLVLVGNLSKKYALPKNLLVLPLMRDAVDLAAFYASIDVFINCTLEDNFPTVNIESLNCGTPVIAFSSGGAAEVIKDGFNGYGIPPKNIGQIIWAVDKIQNEKKNWRDNCLESAEKYTMDNFLKQYLDLYDSILKRNDNE